MKIKKVKSRFYFFLSFSLAIFIGANLKAQMVGASAYIKTTSVEVGVNGQGGFEGVDTTISMYLPGMHKRSGTKYFGFVANPQLNSWATFDGDFFTPGSPENGWGVTIGGTSTSPSFGNNCSSPSFGGSPLLEIPGAISNYSHNLDCYNVDWSGNLVSGSTNLQIKINYLVQQNDLFYTTSVSITNNGTATIPLMYYYRSLDPDNNQPIGGNFSTTNTIEDQPGTGSCNIACVSAKQTTPWILI